MDFGDWGEVGRNWDLGKGNWGRKRFCDWIYIGKGGRDVGVRNLGSSLITTLECPDGVLTTVLTTGILQER